MNYCRNIPLHHSEIYIRNRQIHLLDCNLYVFGTMCYFCTICQSIASITELLISGFSRVKIETFGLTPYYTIPTFNDPEKEAL